MPSIDHRYLPPVSAHLMQCWHQIWNTPSLHRGGTFHLFQSTICLISLWFLMTGSTKCSRLGKCALSRNMEDIDQFGEEQLILQKCWSCSFPKLSGYPPQKDAKSIDFLCLAYTSSNFWPQDWHRHVGLVQPSWSSKDLAVAPFSGGGEL